MLSGQSKPGALVEITVNGEVVVSFTADASGNWRFSSPLFTGGERLIFVTATVGNNSQPTEVYLISSVLDSVSCGIETVRMLETTLSPATAVR